MTISQVTYFSDKSSNEILILDKFTFFNINCLKIGNFKGKKDIHEMYNVTRKEHNKSIQNKNEIIHN